SNNQLYNPSKLLLNPLTHFLSISFSVHKFHRLSLSLILSELSSMASSPKVQYAVALISLCFLSSTHLSFSVTDVHDLLPLYNLPRVSSQETSSLIPSPTQTIPSPLNSVQTLVMSTLMIRLFTMIRSLKGSWDMGK
ncbi:hypothetical protein Pfo_018539, partial [Paulownia fortunei]